MSTHEVVESGGVKYCYWCGLGIGHLKSEPCRERPKVKP